MGCACTCCGRGDGTDENVISPSGVVYATPPDIAAFEAEFVQSEGSSEPSDDEGDGGGHRPAKTEGRTAATQPSRAPRESNHNAVEHLAQERDAQMDRIRQAEQQHEMEYQETLQKQMELRAMALQLMEETGSANATPTYVVNTNSKSHLNRHVNNDSSSSDASSKWRPKSQHNSANPPHVEEYDPAVHREVEDFENQLELSSEED